MAQAGRLGGNKVIAYRLGHRKRAYICVCSSHFATHNGYPLCYEMAHSSCASATQFVAKASSPKGELPRLYKMRAPKNWGKGELAPPNHEDFTAAPAAKSVKTLYSTLAAVIR